MHTPQLSRRMTAVLVSLVMTVTLLLTLSPLPAKAYSYRENGVDVSMYQGDIDWQMLAANQNMRFVVMRVCKLATPDAEFFIDPKFEENYAGARAIGLKVGVYCYCGADTREGILDTTQKYLELIEGKTFDYPVYLDVEADAMTVLPKDELTQYLIEATDMIREAGFHPGVYANLNWFTNYIDGDALRAAGCELWLARYTHDCNSNDFSSIYDVWQYSNKGAYYGMTGTAIDLDVSYVNYEYDGDHGKVADMRYSPYMPMKAYVRENRSYQPYYADLTTPIDGAEVYANDECILREIYQNGWCKFVYPVTGGYKVGYLPLTDFLDVQPEDFTTRYSPAKVYTYTREALDFRAGYIGPYDTLYVVKENDEMMQVLYSVSTGRKLAWLSKKDWDTSILKLLESHVHGNASLRTEQLACVDENGDGDADIFDLALMKRRLDGSAAPQETPQPDLSGAAAVSRPIDSQ